MDCQVKRDKLLLAALLREAVDRLEHEADVDQAKPRLKLVRGGKLAVGIGLLGIAGARLRDHWVTATTTAAAMSLAAGMSLAVVQGPGAPPTPARPTVAPTSYSDAQVDQSVFIPESPAPAQTSTTSLSSTSVSVHPSADPTGSPTDTNSAPTGRPRPSQAVSPQQSDRGRPAHPRPGDDVHDRRRSSTADGSKPGPRR